MDENSVRPTSSPRHYESDICSVPGCDHPRFARGFCGGHYSRWRRTGKVGEPGFNTGGHALRGRPQKPEHVAKRAAARIATLATQTRTCVRCESVYFPTSPGQRYGSARCYDSAKAQRSQKWDRSKRLKVPDAMRAELTKKQDGRCAICGRMDKSLAVDHCHATNTIRGMLCRRCNLGIGALDDDPRLLRQAITYLENHDPGSAIVLP